MVTVKQDYWMSSGRFQWCWKKKNVWENEGAFFIIIIIIIIIIKVFITNKPKNEEHL